jgi:hypothetical protein
MWVLYNRNTGFTPFNPFPIKPTDWGANYNLKRFEEITQDQIDWIAFGKYKVNLETKEIVAVEGWTPPTPPTI